MRALSRAASAAVLILVLTAAGAPALAAADYTQGVTPVNATQARVWFTPTIPAALVDVHYLVAGVPQQNFRMARNGATWEKVIDGLAANTVVDYWFTYEKSGPLYDTPHFSYTHNGSGGGGGGGTGTFPVTFANNTGGMWSDSQIYVTFLGQVTPGEWSYLKPTGAVTHINHLDETAPGHLTKNGRNFANMSFTLAQAPTVTFPNHIEGGRIYLSVGSPMYIPISPDDRGWGGPDLNNPSDANTDVYFDWYELGYAFGQFGFGGNTTQVDQFGFPMTARLQQASTGYDQTVGITRTRAQVFAGYQSAVGPAFRGLANQYRIVAPRTAAAFKPGGAQAGYFQAYIDQVWSYYTTHTWTENDNGQIYTGRVANGVLSGTKNDGTSFSVPKPTTTQVFECSGALAVPPPANDTTRAVGRDFCAAFNRGVALNTADWKNAAKYYLTSPRNDYAAYFHGISIDKRSYAFAYDDVNDQSSVKILGNSNPPSRLTLTIGW